MNRSGRTRNHWLPAALIARFTATWSSELSAREQTIWWLRSGATCPREATAGSRAFKRGLYGDATASLRWEEVFAQFEQHLGTSLTALENAARKVESRFLCDARDWIEVLVPFATAQLSRGLDFPERMKRRLGQMTGNVDHPLSEPHPNTMALEMQRLFAPVMSATWVLVGSSDVPFVLADRGWAPWTSIAHGPGALLPISPTWAIHLVPSTSRALLFRCETDVPMADFRVERLTLDETDRANRAIASAAISEIYGSSGEIVDLYKGELPRRRTLIEPGWVGFVTGPALVPGEFDYHRVVGYVLGKCRGRNPDLFDLSSFFDVASELRFRPPLVFPTNVPTLESTGLFFGSVGDEFGDVVGLTLFGEALDHFTARYDGTAEWPDVAQQCLAEVFHSGGTS